MPRISLIVLLIMFQVRLLCGQSFLIVDVNEAFSSRGVALNACDVLPITDTIELKLNGYIRLIHPLGHSLEFAQAGQYSIQSYISTKAVQDTLAILDLAKICPKQDTKHMRTGAVKAGLTSYPLITTVGPNRIPVWQDTIDLHWKYVACDGQKFNLACPEEENVRPIQVYQLIIKNIFDDELFRTTTSDTALQLIWKPEWGDILVIQFEIEGRRMDEGESILTRLSQQEQEKLSDTLLKLEQGTVASKLAQVCFLKQKKLYVDALQLLKELANKHKSLEKQYAHYYQELVGMAYQKL